MSIKKDVIIIGGGPAGLAAAIQLWEKGIKDILILERENQLGGILRQCIHDGFGLERFGSALSGPEYAQRFIDTVESCGIPYLTGAAVIDITKERQLTVVSRKGLCIYEAKAIILAMGCRERTRGALGIPGQRPSGIYTAGVAQSYINLHNLMIGKKVIILGSGDIGMIMARRLTLEGAEVLGVFEVLPYASGLPRNVRQCLDDYNIPLYLNHTVTEIKGTEHLESVVISEVDAQRNPIPGSEKEYQCDTLILSVGLIPENELSLGAGVELDPHTKGAIVDEHYQTVIPGVFAAGNVLHVHDLVDYVTAEAEKTAQAVIWYLQQSEVSSASITVRTGKGIGYVLPQRISGKDPVTFSMRVRTPGRNVAIVVKQGDKILARKKERKVLPAEMLHLKIDAMVCENEDDIVVEIEE